MKNIKMELLRKKLENVWAKFFNVTNVSEINHKWKQRKMKSSKEWSSQLWTQFMQLRKRNLKKLQNFNGIWTRDLAIPVRSSYQLSYEATDVGSRWQMTTAEIILYLIKVFKLQKTLLHFGEIQEFCLWMFYSQFLKLSPPESLKRRLGKSRKWPTLG